MKQIYLIGLLLLLLGCDSYKIASRKLDKGQYAQAFDTSIKVFKKKSSIKKKDKQLVLLQNSYLKANEADQQKIEALKSQINPDYKEIYYITKALYDRVNSVRPLLPLYHDGKELKFPLPDYSSDLEQSKLDYLNEYYNKSISLLDTKDKYKAREAYGYLKEIKGIDKYYRDVNDLMDRAYEMGVTVVYVDIYNVSRISLPSGFRYDLLNNLNGEVNKFWVSIVTKKKVPSDYNVNLTFRKAFIGDDIINREIFNYENEIKDGWEYFRNKEGKMVLDSLGNPRKVTKYIKVKATVEKITRFKEASLVGDIGIFENSARRYSQPLSLYPVESNFRFSSVFATMNGDKRAITDPNILSLLNAAPSAFPTNYDMLSECGIKFREKLLNILQTFE